VAGLKSVIMLPREADCAVPVMAANAKAPAVPVSHCFDAILVLRLPLQFFRQRQEAPRLVGIEPLAISGVDPEQPASPCRELPNVSGSFVSRQELPRSTSPVSRPDCAPFELHGELEGSVPAQA
jgi:hypothetical protein